MALEVKLSVLNVAAAIAAIVVPCVVRFILNIAIPSGVSLGRTLNAKVDTYQIFVPGRIIWSAWYRIAMLVIFIELLLKSTSCNLCCGFVVVCLITFHATVSVKP